MFGFLDFPKMKIVLYGLTFLGYAYSGYGADVISHLRDAVLTAETVFGDFVDNFMHVAKKFRGLTDVLNAAVDENCHFICPNGMKPLPNRYHKPSSNGCGPVGMEIPKDALPVSEMTECCNQHDICYDTCNNDKEKCDFDLRRCLYKICDNHAQTVGSALTTVCKSVSKTLFSGTITLGCKSYLDAQKEACFCPGNGKRYNSPKQDL
ncbi:group XIIA secretory phospholipase A2 isoform X2 [Thrips palmi]|uniref:Group XIIA secretory phospholipase A2 isoform X2 n=1 Tax=Thrips palmi TaxID=161013 RepID=A0A6P8Z7P6_THRPL|nr:group XIIA secretory phospholipase A2 isoform X2 [Thrips palmi]